MKYLTLIFLFLAFFRLPAQNSESLSPIIFIYDASGSMWGQLEGITKMKIASDVLSSTVQKLPKDQGIGLVAYGHRQKGDCKDVEFLVKVGRDNHVSINQKLKAIKPLGKTPLAYSALQVIDKLRESKMKATIILVTDGIESCGGNLCEVVKAAKKEGIEFKLHIIGFGLKDGETEELKCAASEGNGQYYDAQNSEGLSEGLQEATETTVDKPDENFSLFATKNGKPVDAYVIAYKAGTNELVRNGRSYRDSAWLNLPPGKYDISVKALENGDLAPLKISNVIIPPETIVHKSVSFDGGKINIVTQNNGEGWDAVIKIHDQESGKVVANGRTYGKTDTYELNPGTYKAKMTALVMKGEGIIHWIENIEVKGNEEVDIRHNFKSGIAMIGASSGSELVDATIKITKSGTNENITHSRTYTTSSSNPRKFILNPGSYQVKLVTLGKHKGKTETFSIVVKEGGKVERIIAF